MNKCCCLTCNNERFALKEKEVKNIAMIDGVRITREQAEKALAEMNKPDPLKAGDIIIYPGTLGVYRAVSYHDSGSLKRVLEYPETYTLLVNDATHLLAYDTIPNAIKRRKTDDSVKP